MQRHTAPSCPAEELLQLCLRGTDYTARVTDIAEENGERTCGETDRDELEVRLDRRYLREASDEDILDTIAHELTHVMGARGHGAAFNVRNAWCRDVVADVVEQYFPRWKNLPLRDEQRRMRTAEEKLLHLRNTEEISKNGHFKNLNARLDWRHNARMYNAQADKLAVARGESRINVARVETRCRNFEERQHAWQRLDGWPRELRQATLAELLRAAM